MVSLDSAKSLWPSSQLDTQLTAWPPTTGKEESILEKIDSVYKAVQKVPEQIDAAYKAVQKVPEQVDLSVRRSFVNVPEELRAILDALPSQGMTVRDKHFQKIAKVIKEQQVPNNKDKLRARFDELSDDDAGRLKAFLDCFLIPVPDEEMSDDDIEGDEIVIIDNTIKDTLLDRLIKIQECIESVRDMLNSYGLKKDESISRLVNSKLRGSVNSRIPEVLKSARAALSLVCGLPSDARPEQWREPLNALKPALTKLSQDKVFHKLSFCTQNKVLNFLKSNPTTLASIKGALTDVLACVSHLAERECGLAQQTVDNFASEARRVINGEAPESLKKAKVALIDAKSALSQAPELSVKKRLVQVLILPLETLTKDLLAMSLIPSIEQHLFVDLLAFLKRATQHEALLHDLSKILALLNPATNSAIEACREKQGLLEEGVDTLMAKASELWSSSFSQGSDTVGAFTKKGEEILQLLASRAESALSRFITRSLATVLNLIYSFLAEHFKSSSGDKNLKQEFSACRIVGELGPRMREMQEAQESGDFSSIIKSLKECFAIFRKYDTYIQEIHLPIKLHSNTSPLPKLHELVKTHEETLAPPKKSAPPSVQHTASRLKQRCSGFLTMLIVSKVCALRFEDSAYSGFLHVQSLRLPAYSQTFCARFYLAIDGAQVNSVCKWAAKGLYPLVHHCVSFYVNSAVNGIVHDFYQWKNRSTPLTRGQNIIQVIRNYFSVMVDVQHSVANTPIGSGEDILNLFQRELERPNPIRNGNLTQEQFYAAIVNAFMKYIQFQWVETLENYFNQRLLPPTSRLAFLIPALDVMSFILKITLQGLLYFPQRLANTAIQKGSSFLLLYSVDVFHMVDNHIAHYSNPLTSTSLAVHKIIAVKLKQVIELVHARFNGVTREGSPLSINREQEEVMQGAIGGCINVLLEFLKHNRYDTRLSLKRYTDNNFTLEERAEREIDAFFLPRAMPGVAITLWTALQGFLMDDDLEQLFNTGLTVCDYYFDPHTAVTPEDFNTTHNEITSSVDELVHWMLFYLINGHLDGTHAKHQEELTQFITALKRQTAEFVQTIALQVDRMATNLVPNEQLLIARETATMSMDFIKAQINRLGKSGGGNPDLQEETKKMLNELLEEFRKAIAPLSAKIDEQLLLHQKIDERLRTAAASAAAGRAIDAIENSLCKPTLSQSDFADASGQFARLATYMAELNECAKEELPGRRLHRRHEQLKKIFARIKTVHDLPNAQSRLKGIKASMGYHFRGLEAFARQCASEESESGKQERLDALRQSLDHLRTWESRVEDITLYNIVIIDTMEWVRKWITSLARWRIDSVVGQLRRAFLQRYPYQLAIQLEGVDYLRANGLRREL